MRRIYLASGSLARKQLLRALGVKFKAIPSKIKERRRAGDLSYAQLVKRNALDKAKDVAAKAGSGIIIAADTIMVLGGEIFGKPKDLYSARAMLKRASGKPQWAYTGLAIIDKDAKKSLTGYEKTKVYMEKLTDKEISDYFRRVSPMDKAGSFDIQGRGALFVRRIEGCFYNVVGLPLNKLYQMLKKLKVKAFLLVLLCSCAFAPFLTGCSSEYNIVTGEEEKYYYSSDKEVTMGQAIAKQVEKEFKLEGDPLIQKRVEDIGKKIAAVCERKEIDYYFKALDDEEVNAFSLPGGYVYINSGLVEKVANDDELAGVISHEIAHIVARHSIKKLQGVQGYSLLRALLGVATKSAGIGNAADIAFTELLLGYSREDELLADQLGARYLKEAGYNPDAMLTFLLKLQEVNRRRPLRPMVYFKTHPYVPDRIRVVKQELGERVDFEDYINIEQEPHESR